jgi:hypothetical protein
MTDPEASPHQLMYDAMARAEEQLVQNFERDVGAELEVADRAEALLALVMSSVGSWTGTIQVGDDGAPVGGDVPKLILLALQYIGARALRVMRAARATLAAGYEAESRAHDRVLVELLEHRRAILADTTGGAAKAWVQGRAGRGIGRRVADQSPEDMYANLCQDSHGDPRPLARLLDVEAGTIWLEPKRTEATRASLLMHAGFARDQAVAIATYAGIQLRNVDELDALISDSWSRLERDHGAGAQ